MTTPRTDADGGEPLAAPEVQRALRLLYERRAAVEQLIQAFEAYEKMQAVVAMKRK